MEKESIKKYQQESVGMSIIFSVVVIFSLILANSLIKNNQEDIKDIYVGYFMDDNKPF